MGIIDDLPESFRALLGPLEWTEQPPQGATSEVLIVGGPRGAFVVKRATRPPFDAWLRHEAAVLRALASSGLPVPRVYGYAEQAPGRGNWLLMSRLPGEPLSALLARPHSPEQRRTLLRGFGALLAAPPPARPARAGPARRRLAGPRARPGRRAHAPLPGRRHPRAAERLCARPPAPTAPALIHGDYTLDNVLAADGRISGLIDWFGGALGDPRYDLALATRPVEEAFQQPDDLEAFYAGYGGPRLPPEQAAYFVNLYEFF